jgi:D-alanine-D-alanine ligase
MLADLDVAYPLVSGLEALFEANGVPYIGSEPTAAGVVADKGIFNDLVAAWGYPRARYVRLRSGDPITVIDGAALACPLFMKPARLGASIGVSRISHAGDLAAAVLVARAHDPEVVVEEAFEGIEISHPHVHGAGVAGARSVEGDGDEVAVAVDPHVLVGDHGPPPCGSRGSLYI